MVLAPAAEVNPRTILIGQAPSRDGDPARPLLGPEGKEGLLYRLSGAVNRDQFEARFEARNLLATYPGRSKGKGDLFPMAEARTAAERMLPELIGRRVVLLGVGVARAFGFDSTQQPFVWIERDGATFALSPHPSFVNRYWNVTSTRAAAARFFGEILTGGDHDAR